MTKKRDRDPSPLDMSDGVPDFGSRSPLLPPRLVNQYFVESDFEEEVAALVTSVPRRDLLLEQAAPKLHEYFGCNARLMLAAPWRLFDPIGPVLTVVIYTDLTEAEAAQQLERFKREWLRDSDFGVVFDPNANVKFPLDLNDASHTR